MTVIDDAGLLVAADRNDRRMGGEHRLRLEVGIIPATTAPVVAQASGSSKQAQLRRFLRGSDVVAFSADQSHAVGALLAAAGTSNVVDAHVVLVVSGRRRTIITFDPCDLRDLSAHLPERVNVQAV